jgi:hypothetical protein
MHSSAWIRGALIALVYVGAAVLAKADEMSAPDPLLSDPVALRNAIAARAGSQADVVEMALGETRVEVVVKVGKRYTKYAVRAGAALDEGEDVDVDSLMCKRKSESLKKLDFAVAIKALVQSIDLAAANRYRKPDDIRLGASVFCGDFGWRETLPGVDNDEAFLEIVWPVGGGAPMARKFDGGGFKTVDMKALVAGAAKPPPAITYKGATQVAGDRRQHDYLLGIKDDLARFETGLGGPQAFKTLQFDHERLSASVFLPDNRKRIAAWTMDVRGAFALSREDDTIFMDCNKPFSANNIAAVMDRLPQLVAEAPDQLPGIARAHVTGVRIDRRFICGAPEVTVQVEGDNDSGSVEYEMSGKRIAVTLDSEVDESDEETAPEPVWIPRRHGHSHKHH